jgi:hypothetical protein
MNTDFEKAIENAILQATQEAKKTNRGLQEEGCPFRVTTQHVLEKSKNLTISGGITKIGELVGLKASQMKSVLPDFSAFKSAYKAPASNGCVISSYKAPASNGCIISSYKAPTHTPSPAPVSVPKSILKSSVKFEIKN